MVFTAKLAETNLVTNTDFDTKLQSLNKKIKSNRTKYLLVENELKKIKKIDAAYFRGKNYFDGDGAQNYLVFQPMYKYFKMVGNEISSLESKGLSNGKISSVTKSSHSQPPSLAYDYARIKLIFNGDFLKQDKITYNHGEHSKHLYYLYIRSCSH